MIEKLFYCSCGQRQVSLPHILQATRNMLFQHYLNALMRELHLRRLLESKYALFKNFHQVSVFKDVKYRFFSCQCKQSRSLGARVELRTQYKEICVFTKPKKLSFLAGSCNERNFDQFNSCNYAARTIHHRRQRSVTITQFF